MAKGYPPTVVEPFDYGRWEVPSRTVGAKPYVVSVVANGKRGECQCKHWQVSVRKVVAAGGWDTCYHVERARAFARDWAIEQLFLADPHKEDNGER